MHKSLIQGKHISQESKKKSKRENNPFNLMAWNTFSSDSIIQDFQNSVFQETGKSEYDVL